MNHGKGSSLIEVIVYIALFSIFFVGMITSTYAIFETTNKNRISSIEMEEGSFIISKINNELLDYKKITEPLVGKNSSNLQIEKVVNGTTENITFGIEQSTGNLLIKLQGGQEILNGEEISVSELKFTHNENGDDLENIEIDFNLKMKTTNGIVVTKNFYNKNYLNQ